MKIKCTNCHQEFDSIQQFNSTKVTGVHYFNGRRIVERSSIPNTTGKVPPHICRKIRTKKTKVVVVSPFMATVK